MSIYSHGAPRQNETKTGDGHSHVQPEKYCIRHGWVQAFQWNAHRNCDLSPINGAEFEKPKVFKAAA